MATRVVWVKNNFPAARRQFQAQLDNRTAAAADALRDRVREMLETGQFGLLGDTGALAESLYVTGPGGRSDYAGRLNAAAAKYLNENSRWMDLVRWKVDATAYEKSHFGQRVLAEEGLGQEMHAARAAVGTLLAYGVLWESGHWNWVTERHEPPRHWLSQPALDWAFAELAGYFEAML